MKRIKPIFHRLDRAIDRAGFIYDVIMYFQYEVATDKLKVTAFDRDCTIEVKEKYCGYDLFSMSQSQIDIVIADLAKFIVEGVAKDIWE